ncbi:hypothetical protein M413DRAFT_32232 [Hebeloma cylindrosporum]|uniref:F-box domain-containing protein n=1 Tax=Hebeloma cylindrosporum TaxID=76867 RepID=A0A0C2XCZ8_HEBCY|nr:hypothetical protein M413DRAFT_32232 [Hebeloma cylindrosporum h7]
MSFLPTLPPETIENIIDILAQDDPDHSRLKTCSLVCQMFLELCRKHIFASITIDGQKLAVPKPTSAALVRLLSSTPEIAEHIRKLHWRMLVEEFEDRSLPGILEKITKLQSLAISWPREHRQWRKNSLRTAILYLLHLPTLVRLEMTENQDFVFADLIPCTNLREFQLDCTKPVEAEHTLPLTLPHPPLQLRHLFVGSECFTAMSMIGASLRPDGKPIFNLAVLSSITIRLWRHEDFEASRQLFQHCSKLTEIQLLLRSPPLTWMGIAKMLKPSIETLTHLHFEIGFQDETGTNDPLAGLVAELEEIRYQPNAVEKITIDVGAWSDSEFNQGDDWGLLDRVLTQSGWSKLERVSLKIYIWVCEREDDLEVTLKSLPQAQLPRLSSSPSIVFQFSIVDRSDGY